MTITQLQREISRRSHIDFSNARVSRAGMRAVRCLVLLLLLVQDIFIALYAVASFPFCVLARISPPSRRHGV